MKRVFVSAIPLLFCCQFLQAQSPWTKQKNHAFVQVGASGIFYNLVRYNGNEVDYQNDNYDITTQVYAEYGITDKLEATVILPYKFIGYKNTVTKVSQSLAGLGNISLGLKYAIATKKIKLSTGLLYTTNSVKKDATKGLRTGFEATTILPYITVGYSKNKWYYFGNIGYGFMTNNYSDFVKIGGEVGYNIFNKVYISAVAELRTPTSKESFYTTDNATYIATANYLDRQQYLAGGLKFTYELAKDKIGITASVIGAFALDNIPSAGSNNVGFYYKF
jgi:hypothetical protein